MGFITEVISVSNDINDMRYGKGTSFINKLYAKYQVHRLKKLIDKIKEDEISTKLISEYADYYLQIFHMHSDKKNHIKQILKGSYENAGSITFEFPMVDGFLGSVTVEFLDRYSTTGNYTFVLIGSNSSSHVAVTEYDANVISINESINMESELLNLTRKDKVEYLKNYFVHEITKEIKEFLYSNIGTKEIQSTNDQS